MKETSNDARMIALPNWIPQSSILIAGNVGFGWAAFYCTGETVVYDIYMLSHAPSITTMSLVYEFFLADLRQLSLLEVGGKGGRREPEGRILGAETCAGSARSRAVQRGADWNPTEPAQTVERQSNAQAGSEAERQSSNAQAERQRGATPI